jgi:putative ABC transport system permease protein
MNIGQSIIEALESIVSNKLRSGLTILGIVIGVGAVIAMLGVGTGAQDTITGQISGIGVNLIFVFSGNVQEEVRNAKALTMEDADALKDQFRAPDVKSVAPVIESTIEVSYGGKSVQPSVSGVTQDYFTVRNMTFLEGEFITDEQLLGRASVALIGTDVADKLFARREGIAGETIRIMGQPFRVQGVLAPRGGGSFGSQDNVVLVPFTTAQTRLMQRGSNRVDVIFVEALDADAVEKASDEITQILRERHHIMLGADDFTVFTQQDFVQTAQQITGVFTIFLGGIAAISLLVGGIGIMNIMLVSVTERTREIGLRKALGARKRDILVQFLTESSLLSLIGGVIGIGLGWSLTTLIRIIATANGTPFNPVITFQAILMATLFSAAVGLFFGIYPANRAANLVPVEALRYE